MNTNKKITYAQALDFALASGALTEEVAERLNDLKTALAKRNTKQTPKQKANEESKDIIVEVLTANGGKMSIEQMKKSHQALSEFSTQKMSPMLKALVEDGTLCREEIKGKTYWYLAPSDEAL